MDQVIQKNDPSYRRGSLRVCSTIGGQTLFTLFVIPGSYTRLYKSLCELGLLMCFLIWIATQYNVWGSADITYDDNPKSFNLKIAFGDTLVQSNKECLSIRVKETVEKYGSNRSSLKQSLNYQKWEGLYSKNMCEKE